MNKKLLTVSLIALAVLPLAIFGCKSKVETARDEITTEAMTPDATQAPVEPAQRIAMETIPPTATPPATEKPTAILQEKQNRDKDIQRALRSAGFYTGSVDGKIGPKTKSAIEAFQKAKGLKADGKVGPRTWAELEKYLVQ